MIRRQASHPGLAVSDGTFEAQPSRVRTTSVAARVSAAMRDSLRVELWPHKPYGAGSNPAPATRTARLGDVRGVHSRARAVRWKISERSRAALAKRVVHTGRGSNPRSSAQDMASPAHGEATGFETREGVDNGRGSIPRLAARWRQRRVSHAACKAVAFGQGRVRVPRRQPTAQARLAQRIERQVPDLKARGSSPRTGTQDDIDKGEFRPCVS